MENPTKIRAAVFLTLVICTIVATYPSFHQGLYIGDDWLFEIVRAADYYDSLTKGGFPVRWSMNLEGGYGSPIYTFFPPLPLAFISVQILCGLKLITALKTTIFFFTLLGGFGMYLFAKDYFGALGGVMSAALFILMPYHFYDVFLRSAFSEFIALTLAPFIFFALSHIFRESVTKTAYLVLVICATAFALSHVLSFFIYIPMILLFVIANLSVRRCTAIVGRLTVVLTISFALTSFFILPALFEHGYVQTGWLTLGKFDVLFNLTPLSLLLGSETRYSVTLLFPLLFCLSLVAYTVGRSFFEKEGVVNFHCFALMTIFYILLTLPESRFIWEKVGPMRIVQFPWRLLSPAALALSFISGSIVGLARSQKKMQTILIIAATIIVAIAFLLFQFAGRKASYTTDLARNRNVLTISYVDSESINIPVDDFIKLIKMNPDFNTVIQRNRLRATVLHEYRPVWAGVAPKGSTPKKIEILEGAGTTELTESEPKLLKYCISLGEDSRLKAHLFYFPGWTVHADGKEIKSGVSPDGLIEFSLPRGDHNVELRFEDTAVRRTANIISLAGLLVGLLIALRMHWQRRHL